MIGRKCLCGLVVAIVLAQFAAGANPHLTLTVLTPKPHANGYWFSWGSKLATALLGEGVPGIFWGVIKGADVNKACDIIVQTGSHNIDVTMHGVYGITVHTTLTINAIGGCRASSHAPEGVEAVWTDSQGRKSAILCTGPFYHKDLGCSVYQTGNDVSGSYSKMLRQNKTLPGGGRKLLKANFDADSQMEVSETGSLDPEQESSSSAVVSLNTQLQTQQPSRALTASVGDIISCVGGIVGAATLGVGSASFACALAGPMAPLCFAAVGLLALGSIIGGCYSAVTGNCFPMHATVLMLDGSTLPMHAVNLGDQVAVWRPDGSLGYDAIYAWGHNNHDVYAPYMRLVLRPSSDFGNDTHAPALELSMQHFVPTVKDGSSTYSILHKRAEDVMIGDRLWMAPSGSSGEQTVIYTVAAISFVMRQGLYNPYTLGGNIIVDGVVASAHSEWFADEAAEKLHLTPYLPAFYQAALAPIRMLWYVLGCEKYIELYTRLDAELDFTSLLNASNGGMSAAGLYFYVVARGLAAAVHANLAYVHAAVLGCVSWSPFSCNAALAGAMLMVGTGMAKRVSSSWCR